MYKDGLIERRQRENEKEKRDRGQLESEALALPWGSITGADVQQKILHNVTEGRDGFVSGGG